MENVSEQDWSQEMDEKRQKREARIMAIIAVVVLSGFVALLLYMFFGT